MNDPQRDILLHGWMIEEYQRDIRRTEKKISQTKTILSDLEDEKEIILRAIQSREEVISSLK